MYTGTFLNLILLTLVEMLLKKSNGRPFKKKTAYGKKGLVQAYIHIPYFIFHTHTLWLWHKSSDEMLILSLRV
jgi:hypothetical protein